MDETLVLDTALPVSSGLEDEAAILGLLLWKQYRQNSTRGTHRTLQRSYQIPIVIYSLFLLKQLRVSFYST